MVNTSYVLAFVLTPLPYDHEDIHLYYFLQKFPFNVGFFVCALEIDVSQNNLLKRHYVLIGIQYLLIHISVDMFLYTLFQSTELFVSKQTVLYLNYYSFILSLDTRQGKSYHLVLQEWSFILINILDRLIKLHETNR